VGVRLTPTGPHCHNPSGFPLPDDANPNHALTFHPSPERPVGGGGVWRLSHSRQTGSRLLLLLLLMGLVVVE